MQARDSSGALREVGLPARVERKGVSGAVKRLEWSPLACGRGQAVRLELAGSDLQGRR